MPILAPVLYHIRNMETGEYATFNGKTYSLYNSLCYATVAEAEDHLKVMNLPSNWQVVTALITIEPISQTQQ